MVKRLRYIIESKVLNSAQKSVSILRPAKTITLQSCDAENASEDTIVMAAKEKGERFSLGDLLRC